jgi:hypothetical protein
MTDPRSLNGDGIVGGSSWGRGDALIETTNAVLMDACTVVMAEPKSNGIPLPPVVTMALGGRINRSKDRVMLTFMFDADGAAAIITELTGLMARAGRGRELEQLMNARFQNMKANGDL